MRLASKLMPGRMPERRAAGQVFGELAILVAQGGRKSRGGNFHLLAIAVAVANQGADEATFQTGLAQLLVDACQPFRRWCAFLADPAQQGGRAHHQQRRIQSLAGNIANDKTDAAIGQVEIIVEVARDLVRRQVHAEQGKTVTATLGQQRFLHAPGEVEFALHARLLDQLVCHARIVDGQRSRCGHQAQDLGILGAEGAATAFVDHLKRADRTIGGGQRSTQQAARDEAGIAVVAVVHACITGGIGHDLAGIFGDATADHALPERNAQPGNIDRPHADAAFQHAFALGEEEQRGSLGIHEFGNAPDRLAQGLAQVQGDGKGGGKIGQKDQGPRFAVGSQASLHGCHPPTPRRARCRAGRASRASGAIPTGS
jgi:hypothetical protein